MHLSFNKIDWHKLLQKIQESINQFLIQEIINSF
jgi:hypothetical protein